MKMLVTDRVCATCQGTKKVLLRVGSLTVASADSVCRELVDCPICDDGYGPTGRVLEPVSGGWRQWIVRLLRKIEAGR